MYENPCDWLPKWGLSIKHQTEHKPWTIMTTRVTATAISSHELCLRLPQELTHLVLRAQIFVSLTIQSVDDLLDKFLPIPTPAPAKRSPVCKCVWSIERLSAKLQGKEKRERRAWLNRGSAAMNTTTSSTVCIFPYVVPGPTESDNENDGRDRS